MAVTKENVFKAAEQLKELNSSITLAAIREVLGGGSFTTISPFLQEWKDKEKISSTPIKEPAPQAVLEQLQQFGTDMWGIAMDMANTRLAGEREALEKFRREMDINLQEAVELADTMNTDKEKLELIIVDLKSENNSLLNKIENLHVSGTKRAEEYTLVLSEKGKVETQLSEKIIAITDLKEQLAKSQQATDAKNDECSKYQSALGKAEGQLSEKTTAIAELNKQLAKSQQAIEAKNDECFKYQSALGKAEGQSLEKTTAIAALNKQLDATKTEYATDKKLLQNKIDDISSEKLTLEADCSKLSSQKNLDDNEIKKLTDENVSLKSELSKNKS